MGGHQFLIINANSRRSHVIWDASLLLLVDGVRRSVPLRDPDTQGPFSVTPSEGGTETWVWGEGSWARRYPQGDVPLVVEKRAGAGSYRWILRGGGDSLIHQLLLVS